MNALEGEIMAPDALEMGGFTHLSYTGGLSPGGCPFLIVSAPVRSVSVKSTLLTQDMR